MTKYRLIVALAAIFLFFFACKKENQFTISGKITHAEKNMVYLEQLLVNGSSIPVDSAKLNSKGEFHIKNQTSIPTFYMLKLTENNFITLLIDSAENVNISADALNFSRNYLVEGSKGSAMVQQLQDKFHSTKQKLDSIKSVDLINKTKPNYDQLKEELEAEYARIMQEQVDYSTNFVLSNPFSMASVLALYQRFGPNDFVIKDMQPLKVAASALHSIYPKSDFVQSLYANTLQQMKNERAAQLQQIIQSQGTNSPEIVLPDADGNDVALSSLRGKIVLVHFWSAKDEGSRMVNGVLKEIYEKYKSKDFEIYQVSIDTERYDWIDAIDADKLTWINVGDMEGSVSALNNYNIREIPYNYLLDKEGSIIGQNLKGPALNKKLAAIFK